MTADHHYRSLAKSVSYRVTGSLYTFLISYWITGKLGWALSIGGIELVTKIFLYYLHERIWDRIAFGRRPRSEDFQI